MSYYCKTPINGAGSETRTRSLCVGSAALYGVTTSIGATPALTIFSWLQKWKPDGESNPASHLERVVSYGIMPPIDDRAKWNSRGELNPHFLGESQIS